MGSNDVNVPAATLYPSYVSLGTDARTAGFKVIIVPVPPSTTFTPQNEGYRQDLNAMLEAGWPTFADGYADILSVPETNDPTNVTYYPDGVHPSLALYELWTPVMKAPLEPFL